MTRAALVAVCAAVLLVAGCGGSGKGGRAGAFDPFKDVPQQPSDVTTATRHAAPRWERIATLTGSGPSTRPFTVAAGAVQWRARWRCAAGRLRLTVIAGPGRRALTDNACPRSGTSAGFRTGALQLGVGANGPWRVVLEQQVDTALHEPALAAMRAPGARVLSRGRFYDIERTGRGTASVYRLPGGRLALRLDGGFATSANADLVVWLSQARHPATTVAAARAPHTVLRALKSTLGEQNYLLPPGQRMSRFRSIVIWCVPVRIAYTAATLTRR